MISLCMTSYNGEKYIKQQLDSILAQSLQPDEIIIIDDKSSDCTFEIINSISLSHPGIKWIIKQNEKNLGWKKNFRQAILLSQGDIVFLCDQDDFWFPKKIEYMVSIFNKLPQVGVLASGYVKTSESIYNALDFIDYGFNSCVNKAQFTNAFYMTHHPGCSMAFRGEMREWFKSKYWDDNRPHDEYLWTIGLLYEQAYIVNTPLMFWIRHNTSATIDNKHNRKKQIDLLENKLTCIKCISNVVSDNLDYPGFSEKRKIINAAESFMVDRLCFLNSPSCLSLVKLICNLRYYENARFFFADVYSSIRR